MKLALTAVNARVVLLISLSLIVFIAGALRQADVVNGNMEASDQSAYMEYAKDLRTSRFQSVGDRNRMPVYPGLMALFYRPGMTDDEFFTAGKRVGIATAIVVLITSFFILTRYVQSIEAFSVIQVAAFTVFAYKAPYFQADILFYGIAFALFILMIELVLCPSLPRALAVGFLGGIAHLTKASVLPGLILCWVCLLTRAVSTNGYGITHRTNLTGPGNRQEWRHRLQSVFYAGLSAFLFLVVIFPYIRTSKERFGRYFYNVNSTFYIWCDSWTEVVTGPRAHGDRLGWPDMPPEKIPSMGKYLREHTSRQIAFRFVDGASVIRKAVARSYGYASFVLIYFCVAVVLLWQNRTHFIAMARSATNALLLVFLALNFLIYFALYSWYTPIVSGNRLVLGLFLPSMFCLVWVLDHARRNGLCFRVWDRQIQPSAISPFVLITLVAYLLLVFPEQISKMAGGH